MPVLSFAIINTCWFTTTVGREICPKYTVVDVASTIKLQGWLQSYHTTDITWKQIVIGNHAFDTTAAEDLNYTQ